MYHSDNIFAQMIAQKIPCQEVYQDEETLAFKDIAPAAPVHILVIPKGEYSSFDDFVAQAEQGVVARFFKTVRLIAHQHGLEESGYRLITNHGADASQTVPHFHVHILGGRPLGGLLRDDVQLR